MFKHLMAGLIVLTVSMYNWGTAMAQPVSELTEVETSSACIPEMARRVSEKAKTEVGEAIYMLQAALGFGYCKRVDRKYYPIDEVVEVGTDSAGNDFFMIRLYTDEGALVTQKYKTVLRGDWYTFGFPGHNVR